MITGARQGKHTGLRRLIAAAMAHDLGTFVIPGSDIARAHGLDIEAAGLQPVASPRHASVLLVVGTLPPALRDAAAVVYAQMMRPRAIFTLGAEALPPLPTADVATGLSQQALLDGVQQLRHAFAKGAFRPDIADFDAPVLQVRIEYTCPMHPEVVRDEPGACPKCGMNLVPREAQADRGHAQGTHPPSGTGTDMPMALTHGKSTHSTEAHDTGIEYTCPMHPEVVRNEPGSCPKCGMNLEPRETTAETAHQPAHAGMDHSAMDHDAMTFMSMVEVTRDLPRSGDDLPMDWIDAPFGPFFPGLPAGLLLMLTLDGDTVAGCNARSLTKNGDFLRALPMGTTAFVERLTGLDPLAPVAYGWLACQALEKAAGMNLSVDEACARAAALERERVTSHLGWLALFGQQTGFDWLRQRATSLQLAFLRADLKQIPALKPAIHSLIKKLQRTPLLKSRTAGIGRLTADTALRGPVARAAGIDHDARQVDGIYTLLGFTAARRRQGDTLARLQVRLDEMLHSLALIEAAGAMALPTPPPVHDLSASGEAVVETPRGAARLQLTLTRGQVTSARLETPSTSHLGLVEALTAQQALGDALTAVNSLDLSPWEIQQ